MNYGKKGTHHRQRELTSRTPKLIKMFTVNFLKALLICFIGAGIIGLCAGIGVFKGILDSAPDISNVDVSPKGYSTLVYDAAGNQIAKLVATDSNRTSVSIDKVPIYLQNAFVAIEDARFYEHKGIDIKGILRAFMAGLQKGRFSEGASTITQQLLKNNVFTGWTEEDSFAERLKRKIQEQYLALELEKSMSKEKILENYMNTINLGQNTLGVQVASLRYFNKPVSDITLSEAAVIAGITQNPTKYNPISQPEKNKERREKVLRNMLEQKYITQGEYDEAMADDVYSRIKDINKEMAPQAVYTYFVDELIEQLIEELQEKLKYSYTQAYNTLYSGGLSIYTTLNPAIQAICDKAVADESIYPEDVQWLLSYELSVEKANGEVENHSTQMFEKFFKNQDSKFNMLYKSHEEADIAIEAYKEAVVGSDDNVVAEKKALAPQPQVSVSIMDQSTGSVVAIVGGRGKKEASLTLNRATNTARQPGSTFKILSTYAPAFDSAGKTLASVQVDEPYNYADGRPVSNWYDASTTGYKGICTLREGIEQSLNIVAVKTITDITPQLGYDYVKNFGFSTLVDSTVINGEVKSDIIQSLALGGITKGVKNVELNAAFAAIANNGTYIQPMYYSKILDHDNNILLQNEPIARQVIKETTAFLLTNAMIDVVSGAKGTGKRANFGNMAIAGKTGTTSKYVDVWFAGYTPYYTCTTWAGYDNNVYLRNKTEKAIALNLWHNIMKDVHEGLEYKPFTTPEGIITSTICTKSGKLAIAGLCSLDGSTLTEYFADGTQPTTSCDVHVRGTICAASPEGLRAAPTCPFAVESVLVSPDAATCAHSYLLPPALPEGVVVPPIAMPEVVPPVDPAIPVP